MSVDIIGIRDAGDIDGPPIVDPLIGSEQCAIQRARNTLDASTRLVKLEEIGITYNGSARLGQLHQLEDKVAASAIRGKIIGVSHYVTRDTEFDAVNVDTTLRVIGNNNV